MYIMSCSEVMYQAYYPYLYQRAGAAPPVSAHPVPRTGPFSSPFGAAHQYDRFNVQRLQDAHSLSQPGSSGTISGSVGGLVGGSGGGGGGGGDTHPVAGTTHSIYLQGSHSSGGSVSSTGGASPTSPLRPGKEEDCSLHGRSSAEVSTLTMAYDQFDDFKLTQDDLQLIYSGQIFLDDYGIHNCNEEQMIDDVHHGNVDDDDSQDAGSSRAQYVSANCVVFTHYQGDAATVVDEHFSRALDKTSSHTKESSPMSARNFPPSFWNSQHYSGANGGTTTHHGTSAADLYSDHYHPSDAWYQYSQHHRAVHDYHHHNMAAQYGGLLLPGSRLHMGSHAPCKAMEWQHPSIESPYSTYPTMSGLEAPVQDSSKDLYWF